MFDIVKEKFESSPEMGEIAAAIVQKLAMRSNITARTFDEKLFARNEYKAMLREIKKQMPTLGNKELVDTVFSIGKLHKGQPQTHLNKYGDGKFFQHFFREMMQELLGIENEHQIEIKEGMKFEAARIDELSAIQLAYLSKGLSHLRKLFDSSNRELELLVRSQIVQRCLNIFELKLERFDPYSISKLMRYLSGSSGNESSESYRKTLELYSHFGK